MTTIPTDPPKTTKRTWGSIVRAVDEDFDKESKRPVVYEFDKRTFRQQPLNPYQSSEE